MTKEAAKDAESIGTFLNSLQLSNYEHVYKKEPEQSEDDKDEDPRLKKVTKKIGSISVDVEVEKSKEWLEATDFQQVCADATVLARDLANTRGSVAHPAYME